MKDIDRAISQALASEAESFMPADLGAAEQRFVRRRRRRRFTWFGGATLATAAAVIAVAVFPRPDLADEKRLPVASGVSATISVGESPSAVAAAPDGIWVANSGEGTVSRIDPATNEVVATIEVGGTPDELVIGPDVVWVARADSGSIVSIDPVTNEVTPEEWQVVSEGGPAHLDLAVQDGDLWVAHEENRDVARLTETAAQFLPDNLRATDVATSPGWPQWVYDGQSGELTMIAESNGRAAPSAEATVKDALTSTNGDLALGGNGIWVSDDFGMILRVDYDTLEKSYADVGGAHSDLAFGDGSLWALTSEEDGATATLRRLDAATAAVVGNSLRLSGQPVDVSVAAGAAWVANKADGTVSRVDFAAQDRVPAPSPSADEPALEEPLGPDDLVMVFSGVARRGGMTYAMYGDGRTELLTSPIEADLYPSFVRSLYSDNPAIIIERRDLKSPESDLKYVDIVTGEEIDLVPGSLPAVSPQGQVAYWRMQNEEPALFITEIGTDFSREIRLDAVPRAIEWDAGGRFVYVEVSDGHEDVRVVSYDSKGELDPVQPDSGANARFFAPSSREPDRAHLIRIESFKEDFTSRFADAFNTIKLVELTNATDPTETTDVADLSGLPIDENAFLPENLRLTATGRLEATVGEDGSISWGIGDERSWIVGFRTQAWLVKDSGEIVDLGEIANGGIAVAPEILER